MGMRLIIKENRMLTEESRRNPIDTVVTRIIKAIVKNISFSAPNPSVTDLIEIPAWPFEREKLLKLSPKFKSFAIDKVFLKIANTDGKSTYSPENKTIKIDYKPHYSLIEYNINKELSQFSRLKRESFDKQVEEIKQKRLKKSAVFKNDPPEFMESATANKENLRLYKNDIFTPYYTKKSIRKQFVNAKERIYDNINMGSLRQKVIIAHEVRHSYQFGKDTMGKDEEGREIVKVPRSFEKVLLSYTDPEFRPLKLNWTFYSLVPYEKPVYESPDYSKPLTVYYYYTEPREIDSRFNEYRTEKIDNPKKSYFDIIFPQESKFQKAIRANGFGQPYVRKLKDMPELEMQHKMMAIVLGQLKKQYKDIFTSDPRFEEELQKNLKAANEILNNPDFKEAAEKNPA